MFFFQCNLFTEFFFSCNQISRNSQNVLEGLKKSWVPTNNLSMGLTYYARNRRNRWGQKNTFFHDTSDSEQNAAKMFFLSSFSSRPLGRYDYLITFPRCISATSTYKQTTKFSFLENPRYTDMSSIMRQFTVLKIKWAHVLHRKDTTVISRTSIMPFIYVHTQSDGSAKSQSN